METSNFPAQQQHYNQEEIDNSIHRLQKTYESELKLTAMLREKKSEDKIESAQKFVKDNGAAIEKQLESVVELDKKLRDVVSENRELQSLDQEFNQLVEMDSFKECASRMKSIKTSIENIKDFLCEKGVQGYQV